VSKHTASAGKKKKEVAEEKGKSYLSKLKSGEVDQQSKQIEEAKLRT